MTRRPKPQTKKPTPPDALTPREALFVEQYAVDWCATKAFIRAGYSAKTANVCASQLLARPRVANAVAKKRAELAEKVQVTQERVIAELARIGFADIRGAADWDKSGVKLKDSSAIDEGTARSISEVSEGPNGVKVKLHDKLAALEKLGKHLGMFVERHEVHQTLTLEQLITQAETIDVEAIEAGS